MSPARRRVLLALLLAAAIALIVLGPRTAERPAIVDAVPRAASQAAQRSGAGSSAENGETAMILPIRPRSAAEKIDDAFAARDWRPPPPPPRAPLKAGPKVAVAPPLAYTVIGKKLEDGAWQVFLRRDDRILVVKTLDTIDDAYRVDEIRPPLMTLTHLPTQQRQSLPIGAAD